MSFDELRLDFNRITELPASVVKAKKLRLSGNKFFQTVATPNACLKELTVRNCDIRSLPSELFCHGLEKVDLSHNKSLMIIPSPGKRLRELNFADCSIRILPSDFFNHDLEKLTISGNKGRNSSRH